MNTPTRSTTVIVTGGQGLIGSAIVSMLAPSFRTLTAGRNASCDLQVDLGNNIPDFTAAQSGYWVHAAGVTDEECAVNPGAALQRAALATPKLLEAAVARVRARVPLLAGTGLSSTRRTIAQTRRAAAAGIDCALVVAPAYVRPTQEGLYRHYCEVADHGGLPVVLYNVPSRTACDLLPETVARLRGHGNIVGIKEAVPDAPRMRALLALRGEDFRVLSGDDPTAARAMLDGADGVVSVAANVAPARFAQLCEACARGDRDGAQALDRGLRRLYALLGAEPNPIPVKWCLAQLGFGSPRLRLPLLALSKAHHAEAASVLAGLGLARTT